MEEKKETATVDAANGKHVEDANVEKNRGIQKTL